MKAFSAMVILCMFFSSIAAQQRVGIGTTSPNASAILDVQSTTQGMLVPRMTSAQRTAIANPANGLLVFDVTTSSFWFRSAGVWTELVDDASNHVKENGNDIYMGMNGNVGIGTMTPATKLQIHTPGSANGMSHTNGTVHLATHVSNTTGGFGTTSNHPLHLFANNGSNHITVSTIGNLGLGHQTPPQPLSFASATGPKINLFGSGTSYFGMAVAPDVLQIHSNSPSSSIAFGYGSNAAFFEKMRIRANGRVGIGSSNPHQLLHVEGNTYVRDSISLGTSQPYAPMTFPNTTGEKIALYGHSNANFGIGVSPSGTMMVHGNQPNADIAFGYGSTANMTEKFRMTGSGRLGIGTSGPAQLLHVEGNSYVRDSIGIGVSTPVAPLSFSSTTGEKITLYGNQNANFGIGVSAAGALALHSNQENSAIVFGYGSTNNLNEKVRITGSGRLGIGTTNPTELFSVAENFRVTSAGSIKFKSDVANLMYLYDGSSASNKMIFSHSTSFPTFGMQYEGVTNKIKFRGTSTAMTVDVGNQRVGIGTEAPAQKLDVTGNVNVTGDLFVSDDLFVGYQVMEFEYFLPPFATESIDCSCPPDKTVTGGGWDSEAGVAIVTMSRPIQSSKWRIRASNPSALPNPIRIFAICARIKN